MPPFPPDYRASGLILHVTSLPSRYGIGDVGPLLSKLRDAVRSRMRGSQKIASTTSQLKCDR
ncbi:MAG: hypothetical protein DMG13_30630 [Acidobacteria bacterium]|nr:MAG: hypothetical protein DMG13_30630 [Acidobacteriota bacterium]